MRRFPRRALTITLAGGILAVTIGLPQPAQADLWGGDLPLLAGILAEAIVEVVDLANMIAQIVTEVNLMKTMLSSIESGSFLGLSDFLSTSRMGTDALTSGVRAMSFTLQQIDQQYQQLFPGDPSKASFAQHAGYYQSWNQEVLGAAQVAARQQTVIASLEDSAKKAQDILDQSKGASGEVAQLQLVTQMLSMIHAQLLNVQQTLATTGRVLTDLAASGASERQLSLSKKDKSLAGYTNKGPRSSVPTRLP